MNKVKKPLALVLCLALCLSLCSGLAFADNRVSYLAIGDSTSQGYYTEGFRLGNQGIGDWASPYSYPFLFRDYLAEKLEAEVELYQYTMQGFRPNELYAILAPEAAAPYMDGFCRQHIPWYEDAFRAVYDKDLYTAYMDAVKNADIITYDAGLNNFGTYLANRFMGIVNGDEGVFAGDSIEMIYNQLDEQTAKTCDALKATLYNILNKFMAENAELVNTFVDMLVYCYASCIYYFDKTVDIIYDVNPDVQLLVFGVCNYLKGLVFTLETETGTINLDFGSLMGTVYEFVNAHITNVNAHSAEYGYVNMSGKIETILDEIASGSMTDTTRGHLENDIKALGYTEQADIDRGIEAYEKAAALKTLDLVGIMAALSSGMEPAARNCINDYESASVGDKSVLNLYLRSICANAIGGHPSKQGGFQKYEALVRAYESELSAAMFSGHSYAEAGYNAFNIVFQVFKSPLLEKLDDMFNGFATVFFDFVDSIKQNLENLIYWFLPFC